MKHAMLDPQSNPVGRNLFRRSGGVGLKSDPHRNSESDPRFSATCGGGHIALRWQSARHLRIAVPSIVAHTLIAPALPRLLAQHPELRVQLLIAERDDNPDRYDAAICVQPLDLKPRSARCLTVMPEVLCASEEFLSVHGTPRSPHELNPAHCIGLVGEDSNARHWSFKQDSTEVVVVPASPLMFADAQSAVASALHGGGLILVPQLAVESQIAAGLLRPVLLEWNAPRYAMWMSSTGLRAPELETFAAFIAGLLPSV